MADGHDFDGLRDYLIRKLSLRAILGDTFEDLLRAVPARSAPAEVAIGPVRRDWLQDGPPGNCPECGGECAPECGKHPAGCIYGGFTEETSYWLAVPGCRLFHGEPQI